MPEMNEWQPDPEYTAYLKDTQDEVNATDEFERIYGFEHKCHCAEDYAEGNVGLVADCWGNMANDALATCKRFKEENESAKIAIAELQAQVMALGGEPIV